MAACAPKTTAPAEPALRHVATIAHAAPGEARITCTCRALRKSVDVDDRTALRFVLWDHLAAQPGVDHLLVDDARTRILYTLDRKAEPEVRLILTGAHR